MSEYHMTIQAGQLPEVVWWVPHATSQVAQKSKFPYLIYLQIANLEARFTFKICTCDGAHRTNGNLVEATYVSFYVSKEIIYSLYILMKICMVIITINKLTSQDNLFNRVNMLHRVHTLEHDDHRIPHL